MLCNIKVVSLSLNEHPFAMGATVQWASNHAPARCGDITKMHREFRKDGERMLSPQMSASMYNVNNEN